VNFGAFLLSGNIPSDPLNYTLSTHSLSSYQDHLKVVPLMAVFEHLLKALAAVIAAVSPRFNEVTVADKTVLTIPRWKCDIQYHTPPAS
jgi:hypothetical protein